MGGVVRAEHAEPEVMVSSVVGHEAHVFHREAIVPPHGPEEVYYMKIA